MSEAQIKNLDEKQIDGKALPETVSDVKSPEFDWAKYDPSIKEIYQKGADGVAELMQLKRDANEEAKKYKLEKKELLKRIEENSKMENQQMTADIEAKAKVEQDALLAQIETTKAELLESQTRANQLQNEKVLYSHGIKQDFHGDALKMIEIPEKEEKETVEDYEKRVDEHFEAYQDKYPQWFGGKGQPFDNPSNMSRNKTNADAQYNEAVKNNNSQAIFEHIIRKDK